MNAMPKPSKKSKTGRPARDEFELQELAEKLSNAKEERTQLVFTIWRSNEQVQGVIDKMDATTQRVHIQTRDKGLLKVLFIDILSVDIVE